MSIFDVLSLLGGLAMFLYGMRLMGDSLKENSSGTLKTALEKMTNNPISALLTGMLVTALIQSSTATIVITSGLVGAGILTLHQSLGIIIGANVGTTITGQIIRLLDLDAGASSWLRFFQPSTLAPVALIIGIVLIMGGRMKNSRSIGNIAIGFGILFSGLLNMTGAVSNLAHSGLIESMFRGLGENPVIGYLTGAGVAFMLQSSSATIGILQAFSSTGLLTFKAIYAVIVGIYLGDCVTTAIVCSIGAKPDAKRVGIVNILFNLSETVAVLLVVSIVHKLGLLDSLWDRQVNSGIIANTNTIFNLACAITLFPLTGLYEKASRRIVKDEVKDEGKYKDKLSALNPVFFETPALALGSLYDVLMTMFEASRENFERAWSMLNNYDEKKKELILAEEDEIDHMTDVSSRYMVQLLPHLKSEDHILILNQYYKVIGEFERLGDHAVKISDVAEGMAKENTAFSDKALRELEILKNQLDRILDLTDLAFRKRDVEAATQIEPLVRVAAEFIEQLNRNHLKRMSSGECNLMADAFFSNLMMECGRTTGICSNIGIATVVRVRPELADHEHLYYESLQTSGEQGFMQVFNSAHDQYFGALEALGGNKAEETAAEPAVLTAK